jgi:hypothetical protein
MSESAAPAAVAAATPAATPAIPGESATEKANPETVKAEPKLYEVKVNGKTQKFTEEELISRASMSEAAQQRFNEAAQMRKQAESLIGRMRDPKQVIQVLQDPALGLSKDQIREQFEEWYASEFIEPEKLSPEQKKLKEAEQKLKRYEEEEKARQSEKEKAEQEAMTQQAREALQSQIIEALDTGGLPKTNYTVRRLAYWIQRNNANGFEAPTSLLVSQVKNEFNSTLRDMVESSDGEVLVKLLGDNIVQKLRRYDLEQLKKMRSQGSVSSQAPQETASRSNDTRPLTQAEINARIREMQRTGKY